jgi:hypothetical protein
VTTNKSKPTFGAKPIDDNPLGKNHWRDIHAGRWPCAKTQSDPMLGGYIMTSEFRDPGHRNDKTLPTPLPTKDSS